MTDTPDLSPTALEAELGHIATFLEAKGAPGSADRVRDAAATLRALAREREILQDSADGFLSELNSALDVLARRVRGEADLESAAEWLRLNYPLRLANLRIPACKDFLQTERTAPGVERAACAENAQTAEARIARLEAALRRLLACPDDHMTACEKTIGDTHPCTCGADAARAALAADRDRWREVAAEIVAVRASEIAEREGGT